MVTTRKNRSGAKKRMPSGVLTIGVVLLAALAFPLLMSQAASALLAGFAAPAATDLTPAGALSPTPTVTPTDTPTPYATPTALPSLTPTVSETPIILYTPIVYVSTYAVGTPTSCTVIAKTMTYLRGDPSEKLASIGTLFAGSLLNVTGRSSDGKWWRITTDSINNSTSSATPGDSVSIEGWVRADYVTADSACTDQAVLAVDGTQVPTRQPTNAVAPQSVSSDPCVALTTTSASLRRDPSRQQAPLAQIPEKTALTPVSKTADGQWWQVVYGRQKGWIGSGAVVVSASCATLATSTAVAK